MGSIKIAPDITEIDYISESIRVTAGDIIFTSALIQHQLSDLFAHIVGLNPAIFSYLGHDLDTSKMITAIKRLIKSDDCPNGIDAELLDALRQCEKALRERNKVAHGSMIYVDNMLTRHEIEGGDKPRRIARKLSDAYFHKVLSEVKSALWSIRLQTIRLNKLRARTSQLAA